MNENKFVLVSLDCLPEVFEKVLYAKKMLAQGKVKSATEAAKKAGISRSAFYKYRDCIFTYNDSISENMVNLYLKLEDEPGILSSVLTSLSREGVNIITVNQNIPVDGAAPVSICAKFDNPNINIDDIVNFLMKLQGVIEARNIS